MKRNQIFVNSFSDINLNNIGDKDEYVIDISNIKNHILESENNPPDYMEYFFRPLSNVFHKNVLLVKDYSRTGFHVNKCHNWIFKYLFKYEGEYKSGCFLYIDSGNQYFYYNVRDFIENFQERNIKVSFDGEKFKLIKQRKLNVEKIELKIEIPFVEQKSYRWQFFVDAYILDIKVYLYSKNGIETGNVALRVYLYYANNNEYLSDVTPLKYNVFNYINGGLVPVRNSVNKLNLQECKNYKEALDYIEKVVKTNINPEDNRL